jgi:CO/xanthine dehydrogenase FAD-binding subunit
VKAKDFFVGDLATCVQPGEMVEAARFPRCGTDASAAFVEVGNRWHGFAVVGVAAHLEFEADGRCKSARLAAIGVGQTPVRLADSEKILQGAKREKGAIGEAAQVASRNLNPPGGFHADPAYKLQVVGTLVERAVEKAWSARAAKERV